MLLLLLLTFFVAAFFGTVAGINVAGSRGCMLQRTRFCGISFFRICFLQTAGIK